MISGTTKTVDAVLALCRTREIELVIESLSKEGPLVLLAEFEGYGEYARIVCHDVEYLDWAATVPVRGIVECELSEASSRGKWAGLPEKYPGRALVVWSDESETMQEASDSEAFIIVAHSFVYI